MNKRKTNAPKYRRLIVTLVTLVVTVAAAIVLYCTDQIAGWVAQTAVAIAFGYICWLFGWGAARNGKGWHA